METRPDGIIELTREELCERLQKADKYSYGAAFEAGKKFISRNSFKVFTAIDCTTKHEVYTEVFKSERSAIFWLQHQDAAIEHYDYRRDDWDPATFSEKTRHHYLELYGGGSHELHNKTPQKNLEAGETLEERTHRAAQDLKAAICSGRENHTESENKTYYCSMVEMLLQDAKTLEKYGTSGDIQREVIMGLMKEQAIAVCRLCGKAFPNTAAEGSSATVCDDCAKSIDTIKS